MGPAGPLGLLLWTDTVLAAIVSAECSPELTNGSVVRPKRQWQYILYKMIREIRLRITDVEDNVKRTESAVENISEYLGALGFQLHPNEETWQRSLNPCDKYSQDNLEGPKEMPWTLWGNSKCVKLLSRLFTFSDATARCRQQHTKGQDIGYPHVVSLDSNNAASLLRLLRQRLDGSSVWVGRRSSSPVLNCTEMRVTNPSEEHVEWKGVDCGVLNRVFCEKPVPLSFVELAQGHLETNRRLETENLKQNEEMEELRQSFRTLQDSLTRGQDGRPSLNQKQRINSSVKCLRRGSWKERLGMLEREKVLLESQVARLEGIFTLGEEELRREVELLKGQLNEKLTSTAQERRLRAEETRRLLINLETETSVEVSKVKESSRICGVAVETEGAELVRRLKEVEATLWRLLGTLDQKISTTQTLKDATEVSTASALNAPAWELGGQIAFDVSQAMGDWRPIEVFNFTKGDRPFPYPCEESIFNLTGSTVECTWRWGRTGAKGDKKYDWTVDAKSPTQWTAYGAFTWKWVTTDYANWAVIMWCYDKDLSSCFYLIILARERTLLPATLEMLRNVAEQRGFPKADRVSVNQTSC